MINVAEAVRKVQRSAERSLNLYRLSQEESHAAGAISQSLRSVLRAARTPEEQRWIDRVERLRADLNASTQEITRRDYGAGSAGATLTPEEMRAGVEVVDTLGHISRAVSKSPFWCLVLFKLVRHLHPRSCIEMGTAVGISAAYQAAALKLNGYGALVTLEGASSLADIARSNLRRLDLEAVESVVGRFQDTLLDVLSRHQPVDYVFVDGHHDEQATLSYFEQLLPFLATPALLVFDDIAWSPGMTRAWSAIATDPRIGVAVDLGPVGLCVLDRSIPGPRLLRIPLL